MYHHRIIIPFLLLIFQLVLNSAYAISTNNHIMEVSTSIKKLPVKPNKKRKVKKRKNRLSKKKLRPKENQINEGIFFGLALLYVLTTLTSFILFGIGVSIGFLGLWLTSLIAIWTLPLFFFALIVIGNNNFQGFDGMGGALIMLLTGILGIIIYLIAGLLFLIWGLIIAIPLLWIVGLISFLLTLIIIPILLRSMAN